MDPDEILAELRRLKVPQSEIAEAIGRSRTAATKLLNGGRSMKAHEIAPLLALLAAHLDLEPGDGFGEAPATYYAEPGRMTKLFIRGAIQAGAWLEVDAMDQMPAQIYPLAADPRFPRAKQWLSVVRGDSMNALTRNGQPSGIMEGDLVHVVDAIDIDYEPVTGDVVEVERRRFDGREREVTLKQVEMKGREVVLWPRSTNPAFRQPVAYKDGLEGREDAEVVIRGKVIQVVRRF